MHIQEATNTTLTTCTKMTEEVDRRLGVNGNSSKGGSSDDGASPSPGPPGSGGRLKFFKDGKFILELVGGGREGERGWTAVPRKTFWPPAAPAAAHTAQLPRAERAASLSVSDDNSSIQSSPWQRDAGWKQSAPRRNISAELAMYYCRPSTLRTAAIAAASRAKRRRPLDPAPAAPPANGCANGAASPGPEKYYHMKLKKPAQYHRPRVYKKTRSARLPRRLAAAVERLRAAAPALPVHHKLASCRREEHALVSPRKRILRELERVSLEEASGKRRARPAPALGPAQPAPGPSRAKPRRDAPLTKNASSYSIHSLLSLDERRSPEPGDAARRPPQPYPFPYGYALGAHYVPAYRPLWLQYLPPPPPWPHPHLPPLIADHAHLDDPPSDLPLNLSKH